MSNFFDKFKLGDEKEALPGVIRNIENGVAFRGTNLWVLIFAIFVVLLSVPGNIPRQDRIKLYNWLKVRLNRQNIHLIIQ